MKALLLTSVTILCFDLLNASERSALAEGICHEIMIDGNSALFFPLNAGLSNEKAPYFITIEAAETEEDINDPKKGIAITQGIPLDVDTPYPIGLRLQEGKAQFYKVTVFSDACFVNWKRSQIYSINSEGILAIEPKRTEQADDAN